MTVPTEALTGPSLAGIHFGRHAFCLTASSIRSWVSRQLARAALSPGTSGAACRSASVSTEARPSLRRLSLSEHRLRCGGELLTGTVEQVVERHRSYAIAPVNGLHPEVVGEVGVGFDDLVGDETLRCGVYQAGEVSAVGDFERGEQQTRCSGLPPGRSHGS